jgi:hypothetical protein
MKYISLVSLALLFFVRTNAQTPFNTVDSITINKINACVLVHGDLWQDLDTPGFGCTFANNKNAPLSFAGAPWMSANDGSGQLHVAAQMYRQNGNDYWPGPLDNTGALDYTTSSKWAKIWKVNRTDIQLYQITTPHTVSNVPESILTWPAKGNAYAQGNAGAPLTITNDMAPFVDGNGNGVYEPLLGDYPDVRGDQALWWVFNDNGPTHSQTNGIPLGVEVHAMSYAYNRGTDIDNVMYYEYDIINRSLNNYNNFRFGFFDDIEVGWSMDDFVGFDSSRRLAIGYNGVSEDGFGGGFPASSFGSHPPQVGVTMVSLPGDAGSSYVPLGSAGYFENGFSIVGNPTMPQHYDYYLRSRWLNGQHYIKSTSTPCSGSIDTVETNYLATGDPSMPGSETECSCNDLPGDRRIILSTSDFTFSPGSSKKIVLAFVTTDTGIGGCDGALSFDRIKIVSDTAWGVYHHPPPPLPLAQVDAQVNHLRVYPNPASGKLYIEGTQLQTQVASCSVYNILGQALTFPVSYTNARMEVDITALSAGIYHLAFNGISGSQRATFVKQ